MRKATLLPSFFIILDSLQGRTTHCAAFHVHGGYVCFHSHHLSRQRGDEKPLEIPFLRPKPNQAFTARSRNDAAAIHAKGKLSDPEVPFGSEEVETLEFELEEHKPLGCTVEESLAQEPDGVSKPVFVSKLTEGGNAANAGIQVGDVIVGLTGVFGEVQDVSGMGLEKVRSYVAARERTDPLTIRVQRGTDVMDRHEIALVDLCTLPGGTDDTLNECLDTIFATEWDNVDVEEQECNGEGEGEGEDSECLVDAMFQMWTEELPPPPPIASDDNQDEKESDDKKGKKPEVAPWSSRSSPSGTYVRNPATGKMENIG